MDINTLVKPQVRTNVPKLAPGDIVKVTVKVIEGDKQRSQAFQGVVIRVRKGTINSSFTVRRVTHGVGVERTFMFYSPLVEKAEIIRHGDVRRARLFYLRGLSTKESRAKEKGRALSIEELAGAGAAEEAAVPTAEAPAAAVQEAGAPAATAAEAVATRAQGVEAK